MKNSNKFIVGLVVVAIVIGLGMYLNRKRTPSTSQAAELHSVPAQKTDLPPVHVQRPEPVVHAGEAPQNDPAKLRREKIEEYLRQHNRDVGSLLAAFHALQDTNLLREAATNSPNDPRVQWTVLARNVYPEERRKWLDSFKASSPSNSLANYLSAQDFFKNHQPEAAMKELTEASGKSQFADYSMETIRGGEDLSRFTGASSQMETYVNLMGAVGGDLVPQLGTLKDVANGIKQMQQQHAASGDAASVQTLAQTGIAFANHLTSGDSGKIEMNQLVGVAVEQIVLESLDKNTPYDFLGGKTPAEKQAEFKQAQVAFRELQNTVGRAFMTMSDEQAANYWNRVQTYGEAEAKRWLVQQNAATPNTGN